MFFILGRMKQKHPQPLPRVPDTMGIVNTAAKTVMTFGLVSGPIMLAAGLGFIDDCPAPLIKGNGGTGADKGDWGTLPSAQSWPQTVSSTWQQTPAVAAMSTARACGMALRQVAALRRGVPRHNARQCAHAARRVQTAGAA